ncbi:MAG: TonB family protein [Brevinematales bacterium]|nr:TonB family protein [Brevinematales bacterium]
MKKNIYFYIYLSFVIHCYLVFTFLGVQQLEVVKKIFNIKNFKKPLIENIFVETFTYSKIVPDKALLSDKQNINSSPIKGDNRYNMFDTGETKETQKEESSDKEGEIETKKEEKKEFSFEGERIPTLFDPDDKPIIEMDSEGNISLGTIQYEYASYFLEMQKKIGENWKTFFPVFQYYQGIIKTGEVIIHFNIDQNGNVINPRVSKSYGYSILDQSCLNAVIYSKNFGPLPEGLRREAPISINFKFIYIAR